MRAYFRLDLALDDPDALRRVLDGLDLADRRLVVFRPPNATRDGAAASSSRKPTPGGPGPRVSYVTSRDQLRALAATARPPATRKDKAASNVNWNGRPRDGLADIFRRDRRRDARGVRRPRPPGATRSRRHVPRAPAG